MGRFDDIDPGDIDPETNRPYANYSSPAIDTSFHDGEMDVDDIPDDEPPHERIIRLALDKDGFTRRISASGGEYDLRLLVKPEADLDGTFQAWDTENSEWLAVNGWLFSIEDGHA